VHLGKRPTIEANETYYRGKRDLLSRQKRPTIRAKESYSHALERANVHTDSRESHTRPLSGVCLCIEVCSVHEPLKKRSDVLVWLVKRFCPHFSSRSLGSKTEYGQPILSTE
jgi:hypothetical protein